MDTRRLKHFAVRARKVIVDLCGRTEGEKNDEGTERATIDSIKTEKENRFERERLFWSFFMNFVFKRFDPSSSWSFFEDVVTGQTTDEKRRFRDPNFLKTLENRLDAAADVLTRPEDWERAEVCGWLHQFFIAGRKGRNRQGVVDAEDLAASTQLFTPDWIADYLVQNSLGERLLEIFPDSTVLNRLPFRTKSKGFSEIRAETISKAQSDATSKRTPDERVAKIRKVTFLDPSCGTGHLLLTAYDLFFDVYRELGVEEKKIPKIILSHNLFGLDLDDSAVQIAKKILIFKTASRGRTKWTGRSVTPKIYSFPHFDEKETAALLARFADPLSSETDSPAELPEFYRENGFAGSLLSIPRSIRHDLKRLRSFRRMLSVKPSDADPLARKMIDAVELTEILAGRFDCVVTNPPYLGLKGISASLKKFVAAEGYRGTGNLYSLFIERSARFAKRGGTVGIVAMQSWLFLPTFREFRQSFLARKTLSTLAHLGTGCFAEISGEVVAAAAFCFRNKKPATDHVPVFFRLIDGNDRSKRDRLRSGRNRFDRLRQSEFLKSSDASVRYWISERLRETLDHGPTLGETFDLRQGLATGDNRRFLRRWFEVERDAICFDARNRDDALKSGKKWFPYNKGEGRRRWFGGGEFVVNWEDDGRWLRMNRPESVIRNPDYYFRTGVTWSLVGSGALSARALPPGSLFDVGGSSLFLKKDLPDDLTETEILDLVLGFLGSRTSAEFLKAVNPTLNYQVGDLARLPFDLRRVAKQKERISETVRELVTLTQRDRMDRELSPDFRFPPIITSRRPGESPIETVDRLAETARQTMERVRFLEERNNEIFAHLYGLENEMTKEAAREEIPLFVHSACRIQPDGKRGDANSTDADPLFRSETVVDLLSYFVGVLLGRFELPENFPNGRSFSPEWRQIQKDGFLVTPPLSETASPDGGSFGRIRKNNPLVRFLTQFMTLLWPSETPEANLLFLADAIELRRSKKDKTKAVRQEAPFRSESETFEKNGPLISSAEDRLARYFDGDFYDDHLKRYHRLPIYWRLTDFLPKEKRKRKGRKRGGVIAETADGTKTPNRLEPDALIYYHRMDGELFRKLRGEFLRRADWSTDETERDKIDRLIRRLNRIVEENFTFDFDAGIEANRRRFEIMMK